MVDIFQYFLHIGEHITDIAAQYGAWVYCILFLIIFCESGIVLTPFLPGDSMLFILGTLATKQKLDMKILIPVLISAAILGYWFNYWVGERMASKVLHHKKIPHVKGVYIERTQRFYKKYGPKAVVLARFMPITRTFAPFLAGVANMSFSHFQFYNVISAFLWIPTILYMGFFFGNIPIVRDNFTFVVLGIIIVSVLPVVAEFLKKRSKPQGTAE